MLCLQKAICEESLTIVFQRDTSVEIKILKWIENILVAQLKNVSLQS